MSGVVQRAVPSEKPAVLKVELVRKTPVLVYQPEDDFLRVTVAGSENCRRCCRDGVVPFSLKFLAGGRCPPDPPIFGWGGKAPPDPPLNGRSSYLIEAAKRGGLDQMIFFEPINHRRRTASVVYI